MASHRDDVLDVLLVGAGFAGLYQLDRLRGLGFSVQAVEAGAQLGGTWYWNCYPGARVDTPGAIYQFSREDLWRDWNFSELYPAWHELRENFQYVDRKLDLSRDIRFNTRVSAAAFDEAAQTWQVRTDAGDTLRCRYLVLCTGFAYQTYTPAFEGIEAFRGECHHTARWPQQDVDLRGKRIAVIGTGASGVQVIQEAAGLARQLTVYQRTPNLALPMGQARLDDETNRRMKQDYPARFRRRTETFSGFDIDVLPRSALEVSAQERRDTLEMLWAQKGFAPWLGSFNDLLSNEETNRGTYDHWRKTVHARVQDPATAERLAPAEPPHPFGVKRPSLEQHYYEVFNQPNVALVDLKRTPILRFTEQGIETSEGERAFDLVVLATGFDTHTGGITAIDIRGTRGETLREKWSRGVRAYLGLAAHGFPNLFIADGPHSPSSFCCGPTCAEAQGEWIAALLQHLRVQGSTRIEATAEAEEAWRAEVLAAVESTLIPRADSWWMGANVPGKRREVLAYAGGVPAYAARCGDCAEKGYAGFTIA